MRIQVVTPTYNEAENLPKLVSALFSLPLEVSVLVVDDNSPDGTGEIAERLKAAHPNRVDVLHRPAKQGLRAAYLSGFKIALERGAEAVVQMDADFSHNPAEIVTMANLLPSCDFVVGSRYVPGGAVDREWAAWRKRLSAFGNFYARAILRMPLRDATGGFRMWRRETLLQMPLERVQSNGYVFQVEMAYLAHCLGFRALETPIYFAERRWGESKISFQIQAEAALRVWYVWWTYRDLKKAGAAARLSLRQ